VFDSMLSIVDDWVVRRGHSRDAVDEYESLRRLLGDFESCGVPVAVLMTGLVHDRELIGFSIDERLTSSLALGHFGHCRKDVPHASNLLHHAVAMRLSSAGIDWLNDEQDLGDAGLRLNKSLRKPKRFVRKFTISEASCATTR
jgi:hypothetical protein